MNRGMHIRVKYQSVDNTDTPLITKQISASEEAQKFVHRDCLAMQQLTV